MNKLIISEEVKQVLEDYMNIVGELGLFVRNKGKLGEHYKPLEQFTVEQMALLLCGWYEVEKPFKVGDWVYRDIDKRHEKIKEIEDGRYFFELSKEDKKERTIYRQPNDISEWKKVEEPWKVALLEAGREKPEFVKGDLIVMESNYVWVFEDILDEEEAIFKRFEEGRVKRIHLVEKAINIKGGE